MIPFQEKHQKVFDEGRIVPLAIEDSLVSILLCIAAAVSYLFFEKPT